MTFVTPIDPEPLLASSPFACVYPCTKIPGDRSERREDERARERREDEPGCVFCEARLQGWMM